MSRISNDDKAGIYITVIVHLVVLIILLVSQISASIAKGESFLIDFSRQEETEKRIAEQKEKQAEESFDEAISRRLDELISGTSGVEFKNVAVNRSTLKDDRNTDAEQLYKDAERLASDLKNGVKTSEGNDDYVEVSRPEKKDNQSHKEYSGPSVVSYDLDGRKASSLPIPAYRCYGGGMVTVLITVDNSGRVINAKIQEETSTEDSCLRNFAIRAARMSRFSIDPKAPARQGGNIVYQFVAQRQ